MKPKCFNENNVHNRNYLIELENYDVGWNTDHSIKWCPECGAIVIDKVSDNRLSDHIKMKWPNVTKRKLKKMSYVKTTGDRVLKEI